MKPVRIFTFLILLTTIISSMAFAQDEGLFPGGRYDETIPTPADVLGHRLGQHHTFHWEMERFIHAVDEASDRVEVKRYGNTYQGRTLSYILISSPENLRRQEKIRSANLRLTDPRTISQEEADSIAQWMPSIVWLGYNIHGNEASGMEAAIRTVYQLAAGTDDVTQYILNSVICIIDPCQNPDGHERFVNHVRSIVTLKSHPDPRDTEHGRPWPGGRTNHYLFDLNRDFFLKTQIESKQRADVYHQWMPHVFADLHEMGSDATYFFSPPMTPYNVYVKPFLMKWWNIIAKANARAFDQFGWGYYTKESFDAFYPGYGTSYPSINGAVGMTYEQASARGVSIERDDGSVLTLHEAAWHHFTTSMATLRVVAERREEKIRDFHAFFVTAMEEAKTDALKEIILVPDNDPHIAAKLIANLLTENVEIHRATGSFSHKKATSYMTKKTGTVHFRQGTYIIPLNQPQRILIKALLAPESPLDEEFLREEEQRKKNRERGHFYDVTAWSLPLTYGIDAYWTTETSDVLTQPVTEPPLYTGSSNGDMPRQAYLIPYNTLASSKILIRLLEEDYKVRMARKSFILNLTNWPRGTLVVRVNRNPESLHERISELASEYGVNVTAAGHGLSNTGIDLGSGNIVTVKKPKVALLTESPVASSSYGAMHYLFEREFGLSFIRIPARDMHDLHDFNVVVMPDGEYKDFLSEKQLAQFKDWVRSGGTVVAVARGTHWMTEDTVAISEIQLLNGMPDPEDSEKKIEPDRTPGAIVKVNLNGQSFLTFGCPPSVAALVRSDKIYLPFRDDEYKNVGRFAPLDQLRLSGFIWPETEKYLAERGYLFVEPFGRGKLILFAEDPTFRASYDGLFKLFLNAVLLGPSFQ